MIEEGQGVLDLKDLWGKCLSVCQCLHWGRFLTHCLCGDVWIRWSSCQSESRDKANKKMNIKTNKKTKTSHFYSFHNLWICWFARLLRGGESDKPSDKKQKDRYKTTQTKSKLLLMLECNVVYILYKCEEERWKERQRTIKKPSKMWQKAWLALQCVNLLVVTL